MSWSIEEHIGESRPFPAQVVVYRGETDECLGYVRGDVADRLKAENAKLQAEIAELEGTIECLKGLAEANYERCDTCEAMLDCDECLRADASHKELRGLQAENAKLRELVRGLQYCAREAYGMCARVPVGGSRPFTCCPLYDFDAKVYGCERLRLELGIGVDQ